MNTIRSVKTTPITALKATIPSCWAKGSTKNTSLSRNSAGGISPLSGSCIMNSPMNTQQWKSKEAKSLIRSLPWMNFKSSLKSENTKMFPPGPNSSNNSRQSTLTSSSPIFAGLSSYWTTSLITESMVNTTVRYSKFWDPTYWMSFSITNSMNRECLCGSSRKSLLTLCSGWLTSTTTATSFIPILSHKTLWSNSSPMRKLNW